jgi:hypothetical protein
VHEHSRSEVVRAFEGSLGPWRSHAPRLAALAAEAGVGADRLEPSLRGGERGPLRGGRMMIERTPRSLAQRLLEQLVPEANAAAARLLAAAEEEALPVIAGWDTGGRVPMAKLYVNASDVSQGVRTRIARRLVGEGLPVAPHVVGMNLGANGCELKVYEQREGLGETAPAALRRWAAGLDRSGVVRSIDVVEGGGRERAWFVSLRPDDDADRRLQLLPGWDAAAAAACLPPSPGPVTSVGFSSDGRCWSAYYKPRAGESAAWKLDPDVCVADGRAELGIFVEPAGVAARAYHRSGAWAVSYRVREGRPDGRAIDRVMKWAIARVTDAGADGRADFSQPPEPWRVVGPR